MPKLELESQIKILNECINKGDSLDAELSYRGLTYDDLQYHHKCDITESNGKYSTIDDYSLPSNDIPVLSFFSGCGGIDLGFKAAGFEHVACIDNNELFCETLRQNHKKWNIIGPPYINGDVSDRNILLKELKKIADSNFKGIFIGGPPCQPFSIAANQRFMKGDSNFKRIGFSHEEYGNLLFDYIWFIKKFKPKAFLIENVPGLATIDGGQQIKEAINLLSHMGYSIPQPCILEAANYGVPQFRKRLFIIGSRKSAFLFPTPESNKISCYKALELPKGVDNHVTRKHKAESIQRYMMLKCGERDQLGRVNRLNPNFPSLTIIAGGNQGGGRSHLHPLIPRTLSVRESARLQTFPDSFIFNGSISRQFTQVGNAVPPILAYHLAKSISNQVFGA